VRQGWRQGGCLAGGPEAGCVWQRPRRGGGGRGCVWQGPRQERGLGHMVPLLGLSSWGGPIWVGPRGVCVFVQ